MDANKLKVLQDIGYQVLPTCGTCIYRRFAPSMSWGVCTLHTYQHAKHTGEPRQLSIYAGGTCRDYKADPQAVASLEGFAQLKKES